MAEKTNRQGVGHTFDRELNGYSNSNKLGVVKNSWYINPFHATGLFLYPLKTSENLERT